MTKMRFGILGAARIAARALVPGIQNSDNAELVAVAARDGARAQAFATEHNIPVALEGYQALLERDDIDAIYNPLPNDGHSPWSIKAMEAGKHVLCEKPVGMNALEAANMLEVSKQTGKTLMEAFMWRFHPQVARAKEIVDSGVLGDIKLIRTGFSFFLNDAGDIRWVKSMGGGGLLDLGCYNVNATRLFAGREPTSVYGVADYSGTDVDLHFAGILEFGDNLRGVMECSFGQEHRQQLEIVGTKGMLEIAQFVLPEGGIGEIKVNGVVEKTVAADKYQLMVEQFVRAARGEEALAYPMENSILQMKVLDALAQSARTGLKVTL
jgi:D-xylose 1-dehydrogenase (NADP+, D-xylono-1,5-lactone-forming)